MAKQSITVHGGKDLGDCVQLDGEWYLRKQTWYVSRELAHDMEDANDWFGEPGYYSRLALPQTDEERAFLAKWLAEKERKDVERSTQLYKQNNTALFVPAVDQRVFYRLMKSNPTRGTIVEVKKDHLVGVRADGKKSVSWVTPYYLQLEGNTNTDQFIDLNEMAGK